MRFRALTLALALSALAMLRSGHAADNPVDDGLLEFLGSVDEDQDWNDYLAGTDIDQVGGRPGNAAGRPGASAPPPPPPPSAPAAPLPPAAGAHP